MKKTLFLSFFVLLSLFFSLVAAAPLVFNVGITPCPSTCQLPNCYCPSNGIPGGLALEDTPQFVFFTLDDSQYQNEFTQMSNYSWILNNPNIRDSLGCTLKLSWYAMEIWTDYNVINYVSKIGAINIHTYTHTTSTATTAGTWANEENTLIDDYPVLARVPLASIKGSRAPYLQTNDAYFARVQTLGLQYDSSMVNTADQITYWPFTMDYGVPSASICNNAYGNGCPSVGYAGLWQVPVTNLFPLDVGFMDPTYTTWGYTAYLNTLKANFLCDYNGTCTGATNPNHQPTRSPKGFYWHWRYMSNDNTFGETNVKFPNISPPPLQAQNIQLFTDFYTWLTTIPNVIFATETMVIEWMKNPVNYAATAQMPLFTTCPPLNLNPSVTCPVVNCPFSAQNTGSINVCGASSAYCPPTNPAIEVNGVRRQWVINGVVPNYDSTSTYLSVCFGNQYSSSNSTSNNTNSTNSTTNNTNSTTNNTNSTSNNTNSTSNNTNSTSNNTNSTSNNTNSTSDISNSVTVKENPWPGVVTIDCYSPVGCVLGPKSSFCANVKITNPDPTRTVKAAYLTILACTVEVTKKGSITNQEPVSSWGYASRWFISGNLTGLNMLGTKMSIPPLTTVTFGGFCMNANVDGLTQFSVADGLYWGVDLYSTAVTCKVNNCVTHCGNKKCEAGENPSNCPVDCNNWTCPAKRRLLSRFGSF